MKNIEDKILKTAESLFEKYGVRRISIDEIVKKSKIARSSFYRFFKNKEDLFLRILENYKTQGVKKIRSSLFPPKNIEELKQIMYLRLIGKINFIAQYRILQEMYLGNTEYFSEEVDIHMFFNTNVEMFKKYHNTLPEKLQEKLNPEKIIEMDFLFLSTLQWKKNIPHDCFKEFTENTAKILVDGIFSEHTWYKSQLNEKFHSP